MPRGLNTPQESEFLELTEKRYPVSRLMQLLCVRELASEVSKSSNEGRIVITTVNPGFVDTSIMREASFLYFLVVSALKKLMLRTAVEGGRMLNKCC